MNLIDTTEKLTDFCNILQKQPFITVDSEFIREHSYYPQLCLLQVGYDGGAAIIDPLSSVDLTAFFAILQNPQIVKVFHAGRQDIEIFYNLTGKIPQNVFDTQIAAMVCGYTENIGYGNLVYEITKTELDKSCRLTDWSIRPLDEKQLQYALCDVTYLVNCYKYLFDYMQKNNRLDWINEEISNLCDEKCYNVNPDEAWGRIKHNVHTQRFLSALKYLAKWREERAQKYNTPRSAILKDDVLLNIASTYPKKIGDLKQVRNLRADVCSGKLGEEIIAVLQYAAQNPISAEECKNDRKKAQNIPNNEQSLAEMLKLLLKICSQNNGVVAHLIATDSDLRYIIAGQPQNTLTMQGWRYEIFGKYAERLCRGELSITYNPKRKNVELL
jgi:ribonuclease D